MLFKTIVWKLTTILKEKYKRKKKKMEIKNKKNGKWKYKTQIYSQLFAHIIYVKQAKPCGNNFCVKSKAQLIFRNK